MTKLPFPDRTARHILMIMAALGAMFALGGSASAAFLINCKECHTVPQNGMAIVNFQTTTNLGAGLYNVFQVSPGQTAVIQFSVTNGHGGSYGLNLNNLGAGGVNNSNNHLNCTADPDWTSYFPGTTTNFFMAGPASASPDLWTFNLVVKSNTPADFYTINTQMAGYDAASEMWSQQESFYVQVIAAAPLAPMILSPRWSGSSFSGQVATTSGYTYYLEYKTNLTATAWAAAAQTPGDGTKKTLTDTNANDALRFYHLRVQ
jgi:hypothetical protein